SEFVPTQQQQSSQPTITDHCDDGNDEQITQLELSGLNVLVIRKKDQIIYKLPGEMSVQSLDENTRNALIQRIQSLHERNSVITSPAVSSTLGHASSGASDGVLASGVSPLTTQSSSSSFTSTLPNKQSTQATQQPSIHPSGPARPRDMPKTYTPLAIKQQTPAQTSTSLPTFQSTSTGSSDSTSMPTLSMGISSTTQLNAGSMPSSSSHVQRASYQPQLQPDGTIKTTRKYNKTGKYSKKRALQQSEDNRHVTSIGNKYLQGSMYNNYYPNNMQPTIVGTAYNYDPTRSVAYQAASVGRSPEEIIHHLEVKQRFETALSYDQRAIYQPDMKPFYSMEDAIRRLLPYHIFQYPDEDLESNEKMSDLDANKLAFAALKRRKSIYDKYAQLLKQEAESSCLSHSVNLCERLILEDEKSENTALQRELDRLRAQKNELDRIAGYINKIESFPTSAKMAAVLTTGGGGISKDNTGISNQNGGQQSTATMALNQSISEQNSRNKRSPE
ncbi:4975_t:CDS:2, partial [Paraglomus occultum]